jgi:hypothetical protein
MRFSVKRQRLEPQVLRPSGCLNSFFHTVQVISYSLLAGDVLFAQDTFYGPVLSEVASEQGQIRQKSGRAGPRLWQLQMRVCDPT